MGNATLYYLFNTGTGNQIDWIGLGAVSPFLYTNWHSSSVPALALL